MHEQENRDSFFGPWTDKSTHQSRSQDWKLKAVGFICPPTKTWDPLLIEIEILVHCSYYFPFFLCVCCIPNQLFFCGLNSTPNLNPFYTKSHTISLNYLCIISSPNLISDDLETVKTSYECVHICCGYVRRESTRMLVFFLNGSLGFS